MAHYNGHQYTSTRTRGRLLFSYVCFLAITRTRTLPYTRVLARTLLPLHRGAAGSSLDTPAPYRTLSSRGAPCTAPDTHGPGNGAASTAGFPAASGTSFLSAPQPQGFGRRKRLPRLLVVGPRLMAGRGAARDQEPGAPGATASWGTTLRGPWAHPDLHHSCLQTESRLSVCLSATSYSNRLVCDHSPPRLHPFSKAGTCPSSCRGGGRAADTCVVSASPEHSARAPGRLPVGWTSPPRRPPGRAVPGGREPALERPGRTAFRSPPTPTDARGALPLLRGHRSL